MKTQTKKNLFLIGFCIVAILALPLTVGCAVFACLGGDKVLLHALRGKFPKDMLDSGN